MRQFIRGERAKLSDLAAINHIWEVGVSVDAPFFIVDFCCLGLDAQGQVVNDGFLISYNQPNSPNDAISMDNASNNGAFFTVYLERVPDSVRRLVFTATLHEPEMPGGLIGAAFSLLGPKFEVGEGHILLGTPAVAAGAFTFSGQDFGDESTLVLGEFYWRDEWRFVAAGQPLRGELSAFLQTLTNGPTPVPASVPAAATASPPLVVPPRPPRVAVSANHQPSITQPQSVTPSRSVPSTPTPVSAPRAPIASPVLAPTPPRAVNQPVAQSLNSSSPTTVVPKPIPQAIAPDTFSFPQTLPPGGRLQDLIDAAASGSTLTLMTDEYEGPIIISKPLKLEGRNSALWARVGPVVTVSASDVTLENLDIEITISQDDAGEKGVALKVEGQVPRLQLDNVQVRGRISGMGDEDGDWTLPSLLDLGEFAARANNEYRFKVRVPTPVQLFEVVEGVSLSPTQISAGEHTITLNVRDVSPETLLVGSIEVRSDSLSRTIPLSGSAVAGVAPIESVELL